MSGHCARAELCGTSFGQPLWAGRRACSAVPTVMGAALPEQAAVDPEAAARARMRKQERRATGRKRALDEVQRQRSAGLAVKHRRTRGGKAAA